MDSQPRLSDARSGRVGIALIPKLMLIDLVRVVEQIVLVQFCVDWLGAPWS